MRSSCTHWIFLALIAMACGCAKQAQDEVPQEQQTVVYQDLSPAQVIEGLDKRYGLLKNFSSQPVQATVTSRLNPFGTQTLTVSIVLEKPNRVRFCIAKHHSPLRVDAICDGTNFWVIHHQQKTIYTGLLNEPLNSRGEALIFNPVDIFRAMFCTELTRDAGFEYRITYVEAPTPQHYVIIVLNGDYPNKLYSKIWVNRMTLQIERHELYKPNIGEPKVVANFGDFVEKSRYDIPHKVSLFWPDSNTTLALDLKGLKVNRKFDNPNIFKYDYTDKDYGEVRVTGKEPPAPGAGLQEIDRRPGAAPSPQQRAAQPLGPGPRPTPPPHPRR